MTQLIYTKGGGLFLTSTTNMEYSMNANIIHNIIIRIGIVIYLIFSIPAALLFTLNSSHKYDYPWYKQLQHLITNPLINPWFECAALNGMNVAFKDSALFNQLQDKLFWNDVFIKNGVPTPTVVGTIRSGKENINYDYTPSGSYIIKPIVGGLGNGISNYDKSNLPSSGDYIIQEKVEQTDKRGHFRIITIYDGTYRLSNMYMCLNLPDKLASNNHAGGKCHEVGINNKVRHMAGKEMHELSDYFKIEPLRRSIEDAIKMHASMSKDIITVGWDVMINGGKYYFLEGNVPHSTVFESDIFYYQKAIPINAAIYSSIFGLKATRDSL